MWDEEPEGWGARPLLLVPALAIFGTALYLLLAGPGLGRLLPGEGRPSLPRAAASTTPAPTASVTVTPAPSAPAADLVQRTAPFLSGYREGRRIEGTVKLLPGFQPPPGEPILAGVTWAPGPPRIRFGSQDGRSYRFHVDGLQPGEWLLPRRTAVVFSIGGHAFARPEVEVEAQRSPESGAIVTVQFSPDQGGLIGPTFQVTVHGSFDSAAFVSVPYIHHGKKPGFPRRVDQVIDKSWYDGPFTMYLPRALPRGTVLLYVGRTVQGAGFVWNWVMPSLGGWTSLVMIEDSLCQFPQGGRLIDCFGPVMAPAGPEEQLQFGQYRWELAQAGAEWAIAARLRDTYVLMTAVDRQALLKAAASMGP